MNEIKVIEGGVTAAKGFKAAGAYAGIGKNAEKGDLALVYSEVPGNAAAAYTKNKGVFTFSSGMDFLHGK